MRSGEAAALALPKRRIGGFATAWTLVHAEAMRAMIRRLNRGDVMKPRLVLCYVALVAAMALAIAGISSEPNVKVRCDFCIYDLPDLQAGER
jgi:hypothetical protein